MGVDGHILWRGHLAGLRGFEKFNRRESVPGSRTCILYFSLVAVTVARLGNLSGSDSAPFIVYQNGFQVCWAAFCSGFSVSIGKRRCYVRTQLLHCFFRQQPYACGAVFPETFVFGFFTLMSALVLACRTADVRWVLLTSFRLEPSQMQRWGFITFFSSYERSGKKRAKELLGSALLIAVATAVMQKALYPTSGLFFDIFAMRESESMLVSHWIHCYSGHLTSSFLALHYPCRRNYRNGVIMLYGMTSSILS